MADELPRQHRACNEQPFLRQQKTVAGQTRIRRAGHGRRETAARHTRTIPLAGSLQHIKRDYPNLIHKKIRRGTNNFYKERAMSINECLEAIFTGIDLINEKSKDYDIFSNGEMGIANTTTSSALLYSVTRKNIDDVVGRGGGLSDEGLNKKKKIIIEACERYNTFEMDAIDMLASVGGESIGFGQEGC